ncbi:bifunctional DNA-formamidopyrimidine glycosylase/DNA-(apurinic or apyrimidinic site) lyase [Acidaminococcus fermentans]|uniref:bifunctional DNA-formamidopyrimidine glycosylase/DNA-(apurinic or apyrimidinic site) lyase n=1 Tax=Acidaminococcus fermentans TaxID=905 RepID=UPI00242C8C4E|nr:bifunctional DNA-formamidopyrimidine glycosylase/DNA-(apurinic or apyrimidinic site) lyase [Acidaminococcus fermentans]
MPELPEVEQVRISLIPHIVGMTIEKVRVDLPKMILHPEPDVFVRKLQGARFTGVQRRGKYPRLALENGCWILIHLRMTGALLALPKTEPEPPFTRMAFFLSGEENLYFTDIRTFGVAALVGEDGWRDKGYESLGPEPLDPELTPDYLREKAKGKTAVVKAFLLDQTVIAGLGNIYVDEALFAAGIRPTRRVNRISRKAWEGLALAIKGVIRQGLEHHGTTFRNYQDADGQMGDNSRYLQVYHRKGLPCLRCGTLLKQIKVAGRGSVYCPHCQK